jgi:phenylacetate-CoA ligase
VFALQKAVYFSLPLWLKKLYASIPYAVRMGRHYRRMARLLAGSEDWDDERLRGYQTEQLRTMLRGAFEKVPFYREWSKREGATPNDFRTPEDVRALPLVSKEIIRENVSAFTREDQWRLPHSMDNTSGSTGTPFEFPSDDFAYWKEQAFILRQCVRVGYQPMMPRLTLRGRIVVNPKTANCWAYNPVYNELNLSIYHMTEETLPKYVTACAEFGPRYLLGYPSAISILAKFLLNHADQRDKFPRLTTVFGASEALLPGQRKFIEDAFGCRLFTWYGMTEQVILAGE